MALDAESGKEMWTYDPRVYDWGQVPNGTGYVHRGVAIWSGKEGRRLFMNSRWRLIALDAATGKPVPSFGHKGLDGAASGRIDRLCGSSPPCGWIG